MWNKLEKDFFRIYCTHKILIYWWRQSKAEFQLRSFVFKSKCWEEKSLTRNREIVTIHTFDRSFVRRPLFSFIYDTFFLNNNFFGFELCNMFDDWRRKIFDLHGKLVSVLIFNTSKSIPSLTALKVLSN